MILYDSQAQMPAVAVPNGQSREHLIYENRVQGRRCLRSQSEQGRQRLHKWQDSVDEFVRELSVYNGPCLGWSRID